MASAKKIETVKNGIGNVCARRHQRIRTAINI